ncbi:enolase C-terminal domain-like protein [Flexithrix dorotheae]|uniref:enolase C-terminal domain-like protein n=1 Tax=Flexithrix dorotheae TaxID=70993 RepID=UPI00036D8599|nr:enolase C-terminal domain-like protein [Flexithrix dorotheae]
MTSRRSFLSLLGKSSVFAFLPFPIQHFLNEQTGKEGNQIEAIEILKLSGTYNGSNFQYQAQPLHLYTEHRPEPYREENKKSNPWKMTHHYLRIRTKEGLEGIYGYIDPEAINPVMDQLRDFLIGQDALAVEQIWDKMYRKNRHARAGHFMMAISAIDNTLWDLRAKKFGVPVYQLLGGQEVSSVPVYGSCLGYTVEKGKAGPRAKALFDAGFTHQKWFLANGIGQGTKGLQENIELVKELREAVGWEAELMFDAFMSWNLPYATSWAKAVEQYSPAWIEEAFPTDRMEEFKSLAEKTTIPVATGEHFYNRWEVMPFLKTKAIQVVQADPEWCGGVSELVKICHLASAFGARVFPHGHNLHAAMHVVASQSPAVCPRAEYLINHVPSKMHFQKNPPLTENGQLPMTTKPGFGIEFDESKVEKMEVG